MLAVAHMVSEIDWNSWGLKLGDDLDVRALGWAIQGWKALRHPKPELQPNMMTTFFDTCRSP